MVHNSRRALSKWLTAVLPYLAVGIGLFWFRNAWVALLGFHLAILLSLVLAGSKVPPKILLQTHHLRWVVFSVLFCSSAGILLYFFWSFFGIVGDLSEHVAALGLNSSNWVAFIAYFTLVNPLVEEYFWRGYLGSINRMPYPSDFLYAGFHGMILAGNVRVTSILFSLTILALAGWFWRQIAREDGGLLAPVLGHMAADFIILLAIYRMSL